MQDEFVYFLYDLPEIIDFSEQLSVVSSVIDHFCIKQHFFDTLELDKFWKA